MAINLNDYKLIQNNIYRHKQHNNKFCFRVRINKKLRYKSLTIKESLTTLEYKNKALKEYTKFYNGLNNIDEKYLHKDYKQLKTLDNLYQFRKNAKNYKELDNDWFKKCDSYYNRFIKNYFIKLNIELQHLKSNDINYFLNNYMENLINPKNGKHYSNRHIKIAYEILQPLFKWAFNNGIIKEDIAAKIEYKRKMKLKIVVNATEKYIELHKTINKVFRKDLFWRTFFKFGLYSGRRKGEIIKLKIDNIDLKNDLYIIEDTKNSETQQFTIPKDLKQDLTSLYNKQLNNVVSGLLFENPNTNQEYTQIQSKINLIKKSITQYNFTFHKFRHILVSYLGEQGVDSIYLSGILGHKHSQSINSYLSLNYKKSSQILDKINQDILIQEIKTKQEFKELIRKQQTTKDIQEKEKLNKIIAYNSHKFI